MGMPTRCSSRSTPQIRRPTPFCGGRKLRPPTRELGICRRVAASPLAPGAAGFRRPGAELRPDARCRPPDAQLRLRRHQVPDAALLGHLSPEEFARHDVGSPGHPEFQRFLAVLDDGALRDRTVEFYGFTASRRIACAAGEPFSPSRAPAPPDRSPQPAASRSTTGSPPGSPRSGPGKSASNGDARQAASRAWASALKAMIRNGWYLRRRIASRRRR